MKDTPNELYCRWSNAYHWVFHTQTMLSEVLYCQDLKFRTLYPSIGPVSLYFLLIHTNPKKNKAVYTAALVADGWAGAENLEKQL